MIPFNRVLVLDLLYASKKRLTALAYIKKISARLSIPFYQAQEILKSLVGDEELTYQDLYGATYMAQNFLKPVRVTDHFFLTPPGRESQAGPHDMDILIDPGISFGSGHHPTTCLCLEAIDLICFTAPAIARNKNLAGADIGTGSGVLAIALCLAGFGTCTAWEIDPNAASEARKNMTANRLSHRISVIEDNMDVCASQFAVICANLRVPTLMHLSQMIQTNLCPEGVIILSGIRQWERDNLISHYKRTGFELVWQKDAKNWSGLIMKNRP